MEGRDQAKLSERPMAMCGRQNTADMLRDEARRKVAEAARLNELADQIGHLSTGADEALFEVLCRGRR
jgi:hypothetical protein